MRNSIWLRGSEVAPGIWPSLYSPRSRTSKVGCGFVPARRPGKLPPDTVSAKYMLEYGENALEVNSHTISEGARVVIHDDVLATGGTVEAIAGLVESLGGQVVGINFVIELGFLDGRSKLGGYDLYSLITY